MSPIELMIYAASWEVLSRSTALLLFTPRSVVDAATEVIRFVPLTREEFGEFEARLCAVRSSGASQ